METESHLIEKTSCSVCGSSDGNAVYSDGHTFCFVCEHREAGDEKGERSQVEERGKDWTPLEGDFRALKARGIHLDTCEKYGYQIGRSSKGEIVHIANVRDQKGKLIAQKCRTASKEFFVKGKLSNNVLIGMHLFSGGRKLIITEGEIDMLSWSQVQGNKYPVVSLPSGAQSAKKTIANCMSYLKGFEEIILAFDMDEAGQKAAEEAAMILLHRNVKIMQHDLKDGNELLKAGRIADMTSAIWNAVPFKPSTFVTIEDVWEEVLEDVQIGLPWFDERLTELTYGRRAGEKYYIGAGAGVGKTDFFIRQVLFDANVLKKKVAVFMFETPVKEVFKRIAGVMAGKPFHKPNVNYKGEKIPDSWEKHELEAAVSKLRANPNVIIWNAYGCSDWETVESALAYLHAIGVEMYYIDHLTALATGSDKEERIILEELNADLATIAERTGGIFHVVSHLKAPDKGASHAEGGRVLPSQFKGSRSIEFWANYMISIERNKFAEDPEERKIATVRIIKDRYTGESDGASILFKFNTATFQLEPYEESPEFEESFESAF